MVIRDIPNDLHRKLKVLAAQRGITLKDLIVEIIEDFLARVEK